MTEAVSERNTLVQPKCTWEAQINNGVIANIYPAPSGAKALTLYLFLVYHGHIPGRQAGPERGNSAGLLILGLWKVAVLNVFHRSRT